jgi:hypothetical protein
MYTWINIFTFNFVFVSIFVLIQVKAMQAEQNGCQVLLMGDFHKRGPLEIPVRRKLFKRLPKILLQDPLTNKDPKGFDKAYWLVYYSVQVPCLHCM